jgi:hypothetical protein
MLGFDVETVFCGGAWSSIWSAPDLWSRNGRQRQDTPSLRGAQQLAPPNKATNLVRLLNSTDEFCKGAMYVMT